MYSELKKTNRHTRSLTPEVYPLPIHGIEGTLLPSPHLKAAPSGKHHLKSTPAKNSFDPSILHTCESVLNKLLDLTVY